MTVTFCTGTATCCAHSISSTHAQRDVILMTQLLSRHLLRVLRCTAGGKGGPLEIDATKRVTDGPSDVTALGIKVYPSVLIAPTTRAIICMCTAASEERLSVKALLPQVSSRAYPFWIVSLLCGSCLP